MKTTPSKYIDLKETIHADTRSSVYLDEVGEVLEWLDDNPDQVPGRTITESEFDRVAGTFPAGGPRLDLRNALIRFGFAFVEDREPTNAEKATADLEAWGMLRSGALELGPWLVGQGWVKAPGDDDA